MNLTSNPDISLYQLTQKLEPPPQPLTVKTNTFKALVASLSDLLIEQKLAATLWVKFPRQQHWFAEIERYHLEGLGGQIYWCGLNRETVAIAVNQTAASPSTASSSRLIPILLEASSQLKREYFLMVLCAQFCGLILAQRQISGESSLNRTQSSTIKLIYSFSSPVIEKVLGGIKQAIAITDTTPEEVLIDSFLPFPLPASPNGIFLSHLLGKQIQHLEASQASGILADELGSSPRISGGSLSSHADFLNNLTRELSLPLTNMKTALRLLESKQHKRDQRQRYLDLLQRECDRQSSLLSGLQELVSLNQPVDESESSLRLEDLVPGIVSTYQPIAEEKGISLGYTIPPGFPPVSCPSSWLRQILRNLLHNSIKFTPAKGQVLVKAFLKNDMVELTVSDTGVGIEGSELTKIFQSFYRGRTAIAENRGGAGLGLTITKQLVQRCGGTIAIVSQLGKGTTVRIVLPIIDI